MTRIGPAGQDIHAQLAAEASERRGRREHEAGFSQSGLGSRAGDLAKDQGRFDQPPGGEYGDSQRMFLEQVRRALSAADPDTGASPGADGDRGPRLLAEAGLPAQLPFPMALQDAGPVLVVVGVDAATEARVARAETVAARIEAAAVAEMARDAAGGGVSLRLSLGEDGMPGVGALTVTMSATSIDVVLERSGADLPPDVAAAAQALADRLQSRFSGRKVRILEAETAAPDDGKRPSGGLDDISRLLAGRGVSS